MCIVKRYRRPIRKVYTPTWMDRFSLPCDITHGTPVNVVASWGPFRAIETDDGRKGTCGRGSLRPVRERRHG